LQPDLESKKAASAALLLLLRLFVRLARRCDLAVFFLLALSASSVLSVLFFPFSFFHLLHSAYFFFAL